MVWLDAFFGTLYDDGDELELLGGLNFVGFSITADPVNRRHNIAVSGAATSSDSVSNESGVAGDTVTEALDALLSAVGTNTTNIATNTSAISTLNGRTLTAGAGLTGGGTLASDRTFNVAAADGTITVNADSIQVGTIGNANLSDNTIALARLANASAQFKIVGRKSASGGAWEECSLTELGIAPTSRTLTAGAGLTGGGDLSADRTINVATADGTITVNADSIQVGTIGDSNLSDNTIALARLANATAQYDFVMRNSSGGGAWERGTRANLMSAIDSQFVSTSFGSPFIKLGASGDTFPSSGLLRGKFVNNAGGGVTYLTGISDDGLSTMNLIRYSALAQYALSIGDGTTSNGVNRISMRMITGGTGFEIYISGTEWTFSDTQCDAHSNNFVNVGTIGCGAVTSTGLGTFVGVAAGGAITGATSLACAGPITSVTTLNGATVAAPVEGTALTDADQTLNVSGGNDYTQSTALTANRTKTLGTSGSPETGEVITIKRFTTAAFTMPIVNGGSGAGTLYTFPSGGKRVADFRYNGTDWVLAGVKRLA